MVSGVGVGVFGFEAAAFFGGGCIEYIVLLLLRFVVVGRRGIVLIGKKNLTNYRLLFGLLTQYWGNIQSILRGGLQTYLLLNLLID